VHGNRPPWALICAPIIPDTAADYWASPMRKLATMYVAPSARDDLWLNVRVATRPAEQVCVPEAAAGGRSADVKVLA
jgi:hypothetical protein